MARRSRPLTERTYDYVRRFGPVTADQVATYTRSTKSGARGALRKLHVAGKVVRRRAAGYRYDSAWELEYYVEREEGEE